MDDILSLKHVARDDRADLGLKGEELAAGLLVRKGYRIVLSNFKVPIGRNRNDALVTGEIDIIAVDEETLCFVEVKTRRSDDFASPTASVDLRKQRQIIRTARVYRRIFNIREMKYRYDVVSVLMPLSGRPTIDLFKAFWNEAKFRKRAWNNEAWREFS